MSCSRIAVAVFLTLSACRNVSAPGALDSGVTSFVPQTVNAVGWVDLQPLRSSPLYAALPTAAIAMLDPLRDASSLLVASDAKGLLTVARGSFREPLAGALMVDRTFAVSGTADLVESALAQHKSGRTGAPDLIGYAANVAKGVQIWMVVRGGVSLPLSGNAANWNRLLRDTDFAALTVRLGPPVDAAFTALARTPEAAAKLEDTLRAAITLGAAAESRRPDLVATLRAIALQHSDRTVRATLSATPDQTREIVRSLAGGG